MTASLTAALERQYGIVRGLTHELRLRERHERGEHVDGAIPKHGAKTIRELLRLAEAEALAIRTRRDALEAASGELHKPRNKPKPGNKRQKDPDVTIRRDLEAKARRGK